MFETGKPAPPKAPAKPAAKRVFKYPSESETFVRRLGSAVLACWATLPSEVQQKLLAEAATAWDREYNIPNLAQKLDAFVKRHHDRP